MFQVPEDEKYPLNSVTSHDFIPHDEENTYFIERKLKEFPNCFFKYCDNKTRTLYVEKLHQMAIWTGLSFPKIFEKLDQFMQIEAYSLPTPRNSPDYYIIGSGQRSFEQFIGCRIPYKIRFYRWIKKHKVKLYFIWMLFLFSPLATIIYKLFSVAAGNSFVALFFTTVFSALLLITLRNLSHFIIFLYIHFIREGASLPKLVFDKGIPNTFSTVIAYSAIIHSKEDVDNIFQNIIRNLNDNNLKGLSHILLVDFCDSKTETLDLDQVLLNYINSKVELYTENPSYANLSVLFRKRKWNNTDSIWMGWERKRGKIEEFNQLITGSHKTSYLASETDIKRLLDNRFVILLDSDTILPAGSAKTLVETIAHPANLLAYDSSSQQIYGGYGIIRPNFSIGNKEKTLFLCSYVMDDGFDMMHSHTKSIYSSLFEADYFPGKGIYDVKAYQTFLDQKFPENSLLSHDLIEGMLMRTCTREDVILPEDTPDKYLFYRIRAHRWIRGDFHVLPWIIGLGKGKKSSLTSVARYLLVEYPISHMRVISIPALLIIIWLSGVSNVDLWMMLVIFMHNDGAIISLAITSIKRLDKSCEKPTSITGSFSTDFRKMLSRILIHTTMSLDTSLMAVDAVIKSIYRTYISSRNVLQWTAQSQLTQVYQNTDYGIGWNNMYGTSLVAVMIFVSIFLVDTVTIYPALPIILLWFFSPFLLTFLNKKV